VLAGSAAGLAGLALGPKAFAQDAMPATMAYGSTGYTWALAFLAEGIDAWAKEGVALTAIDFPTGRESMQALLGGSADFATSTDTPVVFAALRGLKPYILASYSRYTRDMMITMRQGSGAVGDDPASLKGLTIATRVGTSGQYMLSRYLAMAGLTDADVTIVDLSPADMMSAAMRGDVDGFSWTSQAAGLALESAGEALFTMTQEGLENFFRSHQLLLTNEGVINGRPELTEPAIRALLAAEQYMMDNPDWPDVIAPRVRAEPDFIKEMTSVFDFSVKFDDRFLEDVVVQMEWAINSGLGEKPDRPLEEVVRELIKPEALAAVAPDRVML
jgi:ABC-type nitrate/sulfonate/bicarbonate transport system substrate-binding protein